MHGLLRSVTKDPQVRLLWRAVPFRSRFEWNDDEIDSYLFYHLGLFSIVESKRATKVRSSFDLAPLAATLDGDQVSPLKVLYLTPAPSRGFLLGPTVSLSPAQLGF